MRPAFTASALCLCLLELAASSAMPQTAARAASTAAPGPSATQAANDAAAKHAKRTDCLKEAKTRKLVGAEKTGFLKSCMDAPPDAISASRISPDRP